MQNMFGAAQPRIPTLRKFMERLELAALRFQWMRIEGAGEAYPPLHLLPTLRQKGLLFEAKEYGGNDAYIGCSRMYFGANPTARKVDFALHWSQHVSSQIVDGVKKSIKSVAEKRANTAVYSTTLITALNECWTRDAQQLVELMDNNAFIEVMYICKHCT